MELLTDYSKFRLKPQEEIVSLITERDNFLVLVCGKCNNEYETVELKECGELFNALKSNNKKIAGCFTIDFLCNEYQLVKELAELKDNIADCSYILVNACGIGMQLVSSMISDKPVYTVADTVPQGGHHGLALYSSKCDACANCYLTDTQGICPVTGCSKELLNGQCGGCKNGKCEVSKDKDCGWDKIVNRIKMSGYRPVNLEVKIRKYNKPDYKAAARNNRLVSEKRKQNFYGGIYPYEHKQSTEYKNIVDYSDPGIAVIPLAQHTGAVCEPLVKPGDNVKFGQKIGDSKSFISAPVHSSVSGKVISVEPRAHPVISNPVMSVIIQSDGKNEFDRSIEPYKNYENFSKGQIIDIIREKGIVGMGGAQFPSYVKLKSPKPIDTLLINGCECEPYLTGDDRMMTEFPEGIITGMRILMQVLGLKKSIIGIETNKPESIKSVRKSIEELGLTGNIEVVEIVTKYPEGAERMLIKKVLNRDVPYGGLPLDVGVVVNNVSTCFAVYDAVVNGIPLVKRVITVTGEKIRNKMNLRVKIGTSISEILEYCGLEYSQESDIIKMGGPMMGIPLSDIEVPVIKGTTGLIAVNKSIIKSGMDRNCIKCGRCVDVCPMGLSPLYYWFYKTGTDKEKQKTVLEENGVTIMDGKTRFGVMNCIECGCCEYICSSKLPLVDMVKDIKKELRGK